MAKSLAKNLREYCKGMGKTQFLFALLFCGALWSVSVSAEVVGNGRLTVNLMQVGENGMELAGIHADAGELLAAPTPLFILSVRRLSDNLDTTLTSTSGWNNLNVQKNGEECIIVFSDPKDSNLPDTLAVTVNIQVNGKASLWDLSVTGVGDNHSLIDALFPNFSIKAVGNDFLLIPKYSGTLIPDPADNAAIWDLYYPRGWSATMQFSAYYNNDYGIYLGFHDPKASTKRFSIRAENGALNFEGETIIPDKTVAGNDWELEGVFELALFKGDWYDAALIYKTWAMDHAEFWPDITPEREARQQALGNIGVWGYYSEDIGYSMGQMESEMDDFKSFFAPAPVGIHWYRWNYKDFDDDYPNYFPERAGMADLVSHIQASNNATIMPYINGRMYDTDLTGEWDYSTRGFPYATKDMEGNEYTQSFNSNLFAVMCPTQTPWQDILVDAAGQLTGRIGTKGLYVDQVAAAGPTECMDRDHHHPIGGGYWWREGYKQMFERMHRIMPQAAFITVEGGADYLTDQVDGFMVDGWLTNNLVPAFQAIYSGRVQLFGKRTGTSSYGNPSFYSKLSQAFVHGVQPGRVSLWLVNDNRPDGHAELARPFVRKLALLRHKLQEFLSFGTMLRPLALNGAIPLITSSWTDYGTPVDVTISAIQASCYVNKTNSEIAVIVANASMEDTISFSFEFDGKRYNCSDNLTLREVRAENDSELEPVEIQFTKQVEMEPMEAAAYIIGPCHPFLPAYLPSAADMDNDGDVDGSDLAAFTAAYQASSNSSDLNGDNIVDADDVSSFASDFSKCGCN